MTEAQNNDLRPTFTFYWSLRSYALFFLWPQQQKWASSHFLGCGHLKKTGTQSFFWLRSFLTNLRSSDLQSQIFGIHILHGQSMRWPHPHISLVKSSRRFHKKRFRSIIYKSERSRPNRINRIPPCVAAPSKKENKQRPDSNSNSFKIPIHGSQNTIK